MTHDNELINGGEETPERVSPVPTGGDLVRALQEETGEGFERLNLPLGSEHSGEQPEGTEAKVKSGASPNSVNVRNEAANRFVAAKPLFVQGPRRVRQRQRARKGALSLAWLDGMLNWYRKAREKSGFAEVDAWGRGGATGVLGSTISYGAATLPYVQASLASSGVLLAGNALPAVPAVPALMPLIRILIAKRHEGAVRKDFEKTFDGIDDPLALEEERLRLVDSGAPPLDVASGMVVFKNTEYHKRQSSKAKKIDEVVQRIKENGHKSAEFLNDDGWKLIQAFDKAFRADPTNKDIPYLYSDERYARYIYAKLVDYCRKAYEYQVAVIPKPELESCLRVNRGKTPEEKHKALKKLLEKFPPTGSIPGLDRRDQDVLAEYATANSTVEGKKEEEELADVATAYGRMFSVKQLEKQEPQVTGGIIGTSLGTAYALTGISLPMAAGALAIGGAAYGVRKLYRMGRASQQHLELDPKTGLLQGKGGAPQTSPKVREWGSIYYGNEGFVREYDTETLKEAKDLPGDGAYWHGKIALDAGLVEKHDKSPQAIAAACADAVQEQLARLPGPTKNIPDEEKTRVKEDRDRAESKLDRMQTSLAQKEGERAGIDSELAEVNRRINGASSTDVYEQWYIDATARKGRLEGQLAKIGPEIVSLETRVTEQEKAAKKAEKAYQKLFAPSKAPKGEVGLEFVAGSEEIKRAFALKCVQVYRARKGLKKGGLLKSIFASEGGKSFWGKAGVLGAQVVVVPAIAGGAAGGILAYLGVNLVPPVTAGVVIGVATLVGQVKSIINNMRNKP
jgi:hypothetical protein